MRTHKPSKAKNPTKYALNLLSFFLKTRLCERENPVQHHGDRESHSDYPEYQTE